MRSVALFISLIRIVLGDAAAQPYWVKDVGGVGNDHVADVKVDADGSIYMAGEFGGTMTLGGQNYASAGSIDLFVAKLNPAGEVLWFKTGGGSGIDRGLKVAVGSGSVLALTGEFLGTATFQGEILTSTAGTADMYVAVLNKVDGSLQWIRQGGGGTGTDRPYGVSIANDGRVSVAGEFRGSATWEGSTITSAIDPGTGQPDSDVFIASYSPAGDLDWLKQGTAKYADRAIDVVHDPTGNLYVTGQFSDTITFDQQHNTTLMNASFLVKYDVGGSEVWFRHMGGAGFNHVRDMVFKTDGRLAIVGDVQGTMIYFGSSQTNVPSGEPYAYYLLDVDQNGGLTSHIAVGSTSGVSAAGLSVQGTSMAVVGKFNCRYTDLSALYGPGVFMAVGPEDLFVSMHQTAGLGLLEGQQFGGRSAKSASAIAHLNGGEVVFTGSYQGNLIFPSVPGMSGDLNSGQGLEGNGIGTYCEDANYGRFVANTAAALTDGFIARGYVPGRKPYDWWKRTDTDCDRVELEPCIRQGTGQLCPDTLTACGSLLLNVDLKFGFTPGATSNYVGPAVSFLWSSGSTGASIGVVNTGTYWVRVTSLNGCWVWTDTIHAIIDQPPPIPTISDDVVLNTASSTPQPIELCDPESHWVWTPNAGSSVHWTLPDGTEIQNDSVRVDTSGVYTIVSVSANGCARQNTITVIDHPVVELPDLLAELNTFFPEDTDGNDTLQFCPGANFEFGFTPTWTVNGVVGPLPEGLVMTWGFDVPPALDGDDELTTTLPVLQEGWVLTPLVVMVSNKPCGEDSVLFYRTDSIYVDLFPSLNTEVTIMGPTVLCDGDSAVIAASCAGCQELVWSGQGFTQLTPESILVFGPGTYSVEGSAEDKNGCSSTDQASISITMPTGQVLSVSPSDGIICPGQSATLSTATVGTNHVWYGPEGPINGLDATLVTDVPGDYYLVMDVGECSVTSNSATLVNYGTPYLDASPRPVLCSLDDEVDLLVVATPGASIMWNAPLSGSAVTQPIGTAGIYSCTVMACGITTQLSIEVTLSIVEAELTTPGPYTLCNGDSMLLQGTANQPDLYWMPGDVPGNSVWVSESGSYYLVAEHPEGCADSTAVVQITAISFPDTLEIDGDSACAGDPVHLTATGSGNISWYADEAGTQLLGTGASFSFAPASSTTVYALQSQSTCTGSMEEVFVQILPRPAPLSITGPSSVCEGSSIEVSVTAPDTVDLLWNTPGGTFTTSSIIITSAELDDSGLYSCVAVYGGCSSPVAAQQIGVFAPEALELPDEAFLCNGGYVGLMIPSTFSSVLWSTGSTTNHITLTTGQDVSVIAMDQHGCAASHALVVIAEDCEVVIPNIFTPNGDSRNENWLPTGGFMSAEASIFNRWGDLVFQGDMLKRPWTGKHYENASECSEGVYYYVVLFTRSDGSSMQKSGYLQLNR